MGHSPERDRWWFWSHADVRGVGWAASVGCSMCPGAQARRFRLDVNIDGPLAVLTVDLQTCRGQVADQFE